MQRLQRLLGMYQNGYTPDVAMVVIYESAMGALTAPSGREDIRKSC